MMSGIPPPPHFLSGIGGGPPPPPPPPPGSALHSAPVSTLPLINIPKPRTKMKTLQWQKIPVNNVIGKSNIWTIIGRLENNFEMDYEKMDELFSLNHDSGPKRSSHDVDGVPDHKRKKENTEASERQHTGEINILDGKRSLNVNIFLKQFRMDHEEIVQMLREGRCEKLGAERLRSLLKLLPSQEEIDAINSFNGNIDKLGNAEKFFICIMKLPNYRMRVEGLLIMEEFNVNMEWIRPSVESVIQAAKDIQDSQSLRELIYLILISGNYLNSGNYAGNAAGFKLSSLLKLTEIRANKPGMNLMHYVALEAEEKNSKLLRFPDEMSFLKDAAQVSIETLTTDINNIASKVRAITEQIVVAGTDFQQQMAFFLKEANVEVVELEEDLNDIEDIKQELATFFCEDIRTFKLEECFKTLQTFCERLKKATEENVQRRIREDKAEITRRSKELKSNRNSRDFTDSRGQNYEEDDGSVVDMLLADVRSGFASRKFSEGNFSVTKVKKVNLRSAGNSPTGGSSPTHESPVQRRSRRSHASEDDESLIDFLMETSDSSAEVPKSASQFERYASLRRRRLERKAKQSALQVTELERERTPSPSDITTHANSSVSDVQIRHNSNVLSLNDTHTRPNSKVYSTSNDSHSLHKSTSLLNNTTENKASIEQRKKEFKDDTDESDALIKRIKQRLSKMDGRNTPPISEEGNRAVVTTDSQPYHQDNTASAARKNSRWRSSTPVSENSSTLETITEKNNNLDNGAVYSQSRIVDKTLERRSNRFRSSPNAAEVSQILQNIESSAGSKHSQDDHRVTVSMRKKISSGMGTDIDGVLKTIEDTGRQIDTVGVTGPIKRTPEPSTNRPLMQSHVSVVAHVTASNIPSTPIDEQDLKTKRDKRKKRSTLSMDDVKAAMKLTNSVKNKEGVINTNSSIKKVPSSTQKNNSTSTAKTPPTQRRMRSNSDKTDGSKTLTNDDGSNNKDPLKAAKQAAAKKKFRGLRFGATGTSDVNSSSRARSNVESDSVDQALKEIACQSGMNRSKSYDEHVAKKALAGEDDFASNSFMRMNSGSAPDTSSEKSAVMRNSISRFSMDGRRNGLYLPSDDSDTELKPEDVGTRRSSKSDSPKSFSQLSLKSVNTSTETLPAEVESTSDQNTKNIDFLSHNGIHHNDSIISSVKSNRFISSDNNTSLNENSPLHRTYSLMERHNNIEEESDSPLAAVAKWRMKRVQKRMGSYDMNENVSPDYASNLMHNHTHHLSSEDNDLRNEVGSRSSYASDKDEGFETASGTMSQRTSMSSNFEVETYNTPTLSRRAESQKLKGTSDNLSHNKSVISAVQDKGSVISKLSEEENRKERTENWTEQTVRVNGDQRSNVNDEFCNTLSPNSANNTSKVDIGSDDVAVHSSKSSKSISTSKQKVLTTSAKKVPAVDDAVKNSKPKAVPSYMLPTSSSSNKPARNKHPSTAKTDSVVSTTSLTRDTPSRTSIKLPLSSRIDAAHSNTAFIRDTPGRTSVRNPEPTSVFKRDTIRASMRAETATSAFQRGTVPRTSIRGPRSSTGSAKSFLSPPGSGRTRSDSNTSISSTTSATSSISVTPSPVSETTRQRLAPTSNVHRPSSPSCRSTTPIIKHTVPVLQSTTPPIKAITPVPHTKASTTPTSGGFTRTQSMRVTSGRTSLGSPTKLKTPLSATDGRRSVTPMSDKDPSTTPVLPERPQSTTPFSSEGTSSRRSSFMSPTASSRAKGDEQTPVAPPRTKSLRSTSTISSVTRSASLRMPKNDSGRVSPATAGLPFHPKPDHLLSTVTEQAGDEDKQKNISRKSPSVFKRISSVRSKTSPEGTKTLVKSTSIKK